MGGVSARAYRRRREPVRPRPSFVAGAVVVVIAVVRVHTVFQPELPSPAELGAHLSIGVEALPEVHSSARLQCLLPASPIPLSTLLPGSQRTTPCLPRRGSSASISCSRSRSATVFPDAAAARSHSGVDQPDRGLPPRAERSGDRRGYRRDGEGAELGPAALRSASLGAPGAARVPDSQRDPRRVLRARDGRARRVGEHDGRGPGAQPGAASHPRADAENGRRVHHPLYGNHRAADAQLRNFSRLVSHEIRQPLGVLQVLARVLPVPEPDTDVAAPRRNARTQRQQAGRRRRQARAPVAPHASSRQRSERTVASTSRPWCTTWPRQLSDMARRSRRDVR